MAEAACASRRLIERVYALEPDGHVARYDELRDPLAARDLERLRPVIDEKYANLTTVAGIYRARAVEDGHAVAKRQPRTRANLPFGTLGKRNLKTRRHERELAGRKRERFVFGHGSAEVQAGTPWIGMSGQVETLTVRKNDDGDGSRFSHGPNR